MITSGIFQDKRKYSTCYLLCRYCVFTLWGRVAHCFKIRYRQYGFVFLCVLWQRLWYIKYFPQNVLLIIDAEIHFTWGIDLKQDRLLHLILFLFKRACLSRDGFSNLKPNLACMKCLLRLMLTNGCQTMSHDASLCLITKHKNYSQYPCHRCNFKFKQNICMSFKVHARGQW